MQVSFPKVASLRLVAPRYGQTLQAVPDSFLGGSAASLRSFFLYDILFPGLSKFLLSATHLVHLHLHIPQPAYIPPDEMITCLSVLTSLENFALRFRSFQSNPDRETQRSPLATYSVLSALRALEFQGSSGYLECLVARINAPRLCDFYITFEYQPDFSIPQLFKFISRTPALKALVDAHVVFKRYIARVRLNSRTFGGGDFYVEIPCGRPDLQLSSLVQVLASSSLPLLTVENLYIKDEGSGLEKSSPVEVTQWRELLRPFVGVKNIYMFETVAFHIAYSFQALGVGIEVLPILQNIFLRPPEVELQDPSLLHSQGHMGQFVAARQLLGHSIAITASNW